MARETSIKQCMLNRAQKERELVLTPELLNEVLRV